MDLLEFMMELVLFGGEKYDFIYNRIRYLIGLKSALNYSKIKVDSYEPLLLEKTLSKTLD